MNVRSTVAALLQRYLADPQLPAARVLPSAGLAIEVTDASGRVTHNFDPRRAVVQLAQREVRIWKDSADRDSRDAVNAPWTFTSDSPVVLQRLYGDVVRALRAPGRGLSLKPILAGAAVAVTILVVGGKAPAPSAGVTPTAAPAQVTAPAAPVLVAGTAPVPPTPPQAVLNAEEAKLVGTLKGVKLPGTGATYYVFSDPNCPFCKDLEKAVDTVAGYTPVVLPLGYKPGSRDLSAAVMCSADPAKEWKRAIAGTSAAKPCEQGYQLVDASMRAFEKLGLSSTPTMVTPKGTLVTGAATPDELRAVLQR
jgi:protein-disulfide isomerase